MENALIIKILQGNEHAFQLLVEKYHLHIFKHVFAVLRHQKDTEDAVQEVFVKIYTSLPQYEYQGFKTWITRISVNHAIDIKRKQKRRHEEPLTDIHLELLQNRSEDSIEQILTKKEIHHLVRSKLNELPPNYREIIYKFYIEEKSYQQLAREANVQVKTIETTLYRARVWMRKHWKEEDFL